MKGCFIPLVLPADSEEMLLLAFEERRVHGSTNKPATNSRDFSHPVLLGADSQLTADGKVRITQGEFAKLERRLAKTRRRSGRRAHVIAELRKPHRGEHPRRRRRPGGEVR
jgi:hypothetical protein